MHFNIIILYHKEYKYLETFTTINFHYCMIKSVKQFKLQQNYKQSNKISIYFCRKRSMCESRWWAVQ